MSQDFHLENDDIDEDEYMDDDFEEVSPRPKNEGHPASQSIQLDDNSNLAIQPNQPSNNNNGRTSQAAAAAIAVSPQQVQQEPIRQGVIGNLEYGMRSQSPIRSRGTTPKARAQQQAKHSRQQDRQQHGSQNKSSNADLSEVVTKQNRKRRPPRNQDSQASMAADDRSQMTANSGTKQSNASRNQKQRVSQSRMEEGTVLEQQPSIFNKKSQSSQNYTTPSQAHTSVNTRNLRESDKQNVNLKAATISTLPDVATKDSRLSQKNNTDYSAAGNQDDYPSSGPTNIILPAKLKGGKQVVVQKNKNQSLNTSLTHIEGSDPGTLLREQEQQMMQHNASMALQSKTTTLQEQQAAQKQNQTAKNNAKNLQKQNYIKAPYQLTSQSVKTSVDQHQQEDLRNRAQPKSTKNATAQEMPHIYIHQNKMRGNGTLQGANTGNQTITKGMNNMHATFNEQQNQQQQLPSARKNNSKHQNVGQPYRIRTKLPFYDSRGVYQGGRIPVVGSNNTGGGGASQHNANIQRKIQQFETAYNTVQQPQQNNKKARSIGQTSLLPNPHQSILPADLSSDQHALGAQANPRESFESSNKHAKNMTTIQPSTTNDEFSETIQEYQTSGDPRVLNSLIVRRGVSEYSGGSRGGAVRPPSLNNFKLKINNDLRSSVESVQGNSAISQMARQKRGAFQTNYKIVQEVPFVESVNNYNQMSQNRRSRRKILAHSNNNASKANLNPEGLQEQANQASRASLLSSVAECGKHAERIQNLDSAVESMKEELRIKDRLISKLLDNDDSPDDVNRKMAMQTSDEMRQTHKANLAVKLKSELDLAYKILSQRDTEINAMKKQAKQQAFKECNEERVLYMNECMKLQSLLKIYGGSNLRKQFKGVKVTQHQENVTRNSVSKSGEKITKISSRSKSPSALQAKDKASSRKPLTSDVQAKMHLSGAFPENTKDILLQEEPSFIDELQRKVKELLEINENLTQDLLSKDEELEEAQSQIEQMALDMRGLEQNLIEKADLAKSLQDMGDEHAEQVNSLESNIAQLKTSTDEEIKKQSSQIKNQSSEIKKQSSEIKKQSSEIDALKKQLSSNDQQAVLLEQLEKLKSDHESALYEKEMELESLTEQLSGLTEQLADKSKSEQTDDELKKLKAQLESAMIEIDSLKLKVVKAEQKNDELVKNQTTEDTELAEKLQEAESLSESLQLKVKHSVQEIEHLKDKIESLEQQLLTERAESDEKIATGSSRIRDLENQLDELKETQRRDEILAQKQKSKSKADDKQSATEQIGDLELQNAELEAEIETLKKQVQRLETDLTGQQSGRVVIQNLEDKKNFANLISTQGNLLENLEIAQSKARVLEEKVLEHEKSVSILSARRVDAQTQTENEQVEEENYEDDFNNQSQMLSEIRKTDTGNNVSRTEKMQLSAQVEQLESQQIQDSEIECDESETLQTVQKDIKDAIENYDRMTYRALRGKERTLLKAELTKVQQALVKKNELINSTIESQERLAENSVMLKERLDKSQAELEESEVQLKHSASELQQKNDKLLEMSTKQNKLIEEKQASDKLSKQRLDGLKDIARIILKEQFTAYRVTDQNRLAGMLEYDPERVLEGQFLLPESAQQLIDCSAQGLFNLMDSRILPEVTETELEIGFRKLKEIFDEKKIDYKTFIFELDSIDNDDDKDADEIRIAVSKDTKMALPLMREEFIERVSTEDVLNDPALSQKIAIGCQQIARSVCFVHYWAFNCLWMQFNGKRDEGNKKLTMKQLLEQVAADKALKEEMIADLQQQKQDEAERAQREKEEAQAEAERHKLEMEEAQRQRETDLAEQARLREEELTEAARLKEEEAKRREEELAEAARVREQEAKKREEDIAEQAKKREQEIAEQARLRENELAEAAIVREEQAKKREEDLAEQSRLKDEQAQKREQDLAEAARQKELEMAETAKQKELEMTEAAKQRDLEAKKREEELAEAAQRREEQLLEAARQNEELIRQQQNNSQQDITDGQDGDLEGFSVEIYKHIKQDADLSVIVSIANASLYSLRNQINVFNVDSRKLIDGHTNADIEEPPFASLTEERDEQNRIQLDPDNKEVEVIYHDDFFKLVLADMGLKKYLEIPEESEKLNQCLERIGATCSDNQTQRKLIRLEVLMAAMRIHKYEYSGLNLATKLQNVDFRILNPRSMRIMNRLTRVVAQYQDKYQQKAKEGVKIQIGQIVNAIFKNQVEVRAIDRNLLSPSPVLEQPTTEGAITISQMDSSPKAQVQVLPKIKFYQTLNKLKVKKGESESANLSRFLRINGIQNDVFGFKKLVKVIEEFLRNHYLKSFSYNKKRLGELTQRNGIHGAEYGVEEEEEYYYDEEVPAAENEPKQKQAPPFLQSNPETIQQQLQMIQTTQQQQQQALQPTPEYGDEEEYYYDEEVPAGEAQDQNQDLPAYQMKTHQDISQPIQDDDTNPMRNIRLDKPINHRFVAENRSLELAPNTHANSTRFLSKESNQHLNLTSQNSMQEFKAFNSQIGHYPKRTSHQSIDGGAKFSEGYRAEPEASSKYPGSISGADPSLMGKGDDDDFF